MLGLENMEHILSSMGNPERGMRYVHIAGTNGKGSVLAYISTVLKTAGHKVGVFYSPALSDPWEKIRVNGRKISKKDVETGIKVIQSTGVLPTIFELETALAFWYFRQKACDIVVLECGLGGRDDATNVIPAPFVCVFTPISYDHMAILGNSLEEIAGVKSGIIKPGAAVVSASQAPEAEEVLRKKAEEMHCSFQRAAIPAKVHYGLFKQHFTLPGHEKLTVSLAGTVQVENAALAVTALDVLREKGVEIPEKALQKGLETTVWEGRFTVLKRRPYFIMDGAHNEAAALRLHETLEQLFPGQKFVMILGVLRDKEYDKVLKILSPHAVQLVTVTPPENPRALSSVELAQAAMEYIPQVSAAGSVEEGVEIAELLAGGKYPILATGSLSYLGKLRDCVRKPAK